MPTLVPCPACDRHVKTEAVCPFCGSERRIRFGKLYSGVRDTLAELTAPLTLQRDRHLLSIEAGMLAKEPMRVDLEGWVSQQRADLDASSSMV